MFKKTLLALLPGLLLYLGWAGIGITPLLFIAFVPLLFLEKQLSAEAKTNISWFGYSFLATAFWCLIATWWVAYDHWLALPAVVLVCSLLMSLVLLIFRLVKNKLGAQRGYIGLPFFWIAMEGLHNHWDFAFPWLNLGNGLANRPEIIQWYEYLGVAGGSLWIWWINLLIFGVAHSFLEKKNSRAARMITGSVLLLAIPLWISLKHYNNYKPHGEQVQFVVVQPNLGIPADRSGKTSLERARKFVELVKPETSDSTDFILGPEVMLTRTLQLEKLKNYPEIELLQDYTDEFHSGGIIVGAITRQNYAGQYTENARQDTAGSWYEIFNSALLIQKGKPVQVYHKSKLVAGTEVLPYANILQPLSNTWLSGFGLHPAGFGRQHKPETFNLANEDLRLAPLICWEADFGEHVTHFTRGGANLFAMLSNDSWAGGSVASEQHLHYARLRCIENRRSAARSANTGISAVINQRGDLQNVQDSGTEAALSAKLHTNNELTYYSRAGDVVTRVSYFLTAFLLLFAVVRGYLQKQDTKI